MDEFDKFYNKALKFLSYRPRSEKEVRNKLKSLIKRHSGADAPQNDGAETIVDKVIQKLKEHKFINDKEFAKWWIESRLRFKPRSLRLIKLELKQKGIDSETIDKMINDEGLMINDLEQAKKLAGKRIERLNGLPKQKIYEKLGRYLASKGFDWDVIKQVIDPVKS